jgi:uncharacterized membrane protein
VTGEARKALAIGNRLAPRRFLLFVAVVVAGYFAYRAAWPASKWADAAAMAFDAGAVVFLASLLPLLRDNSADIIRDHAARNDANRGVILVVTSLLTIAAMVAIAGELEGARQGELLPLAKLVGTLLLIWLFANSIYALHYAHAWYTRSKESGSDLGGIEFPGTEAPDYGDFVYFAFTLGMTFQTSDANITAAGIRHVALLHSFFAFLFSIGVIAFTINVLGGGS